MNSRARSVRKGVAIATLASLVLSPAQPILSAMPQQAPAPKPAGAAAKPATTAAKPVDSQAARDRATQSGTQARDRSASSGFDSSQLNRDAYARGEGTTRTRDYGSVRSGASSRSGSYRAGGGGFRGGGGRRR